MGRQQVTFWVLEAGYDFCSEEVKHPPTVPKSVFSEGSYRHKFDTGKGMEELGNVCKLKLLGGKEEDK